MTVTEDELEFALHSVREYFSGKTVTVNTVLAAYLRASGLPASGQPWGAAKSAMCDGLTFQEAVSRAQQARDRDSQAHGVSTNQEPTPFAGQSLDWFAKQFGPGDIDGVGAKRLLGTPNIKPPEVLVRETAQNSWDARGTSQSVDFTLNLRELSREEMAVLGGRILTGNPPISGLEELLDRDTVWVIEVSDRQTVGLGGPIRNDLAVDPGEDTNFIDFVFNIGAPRDVHLGGGTYGFGKTISYVVSSVGTVLVWSRCEGPRGPEHRIIGSAIGDGFNMAGLRYTGRHWWGNVIEDQDRVEPVTGEIAQEIGEAVFASHFGNSDTGTSILIIDPQLGGEDRVEDVRLIADAAITNLWPKLRDSQVDQSQMSISVQLNGETQQLPRIQSHSQLSGYARCLDVVRKVQSGIKYDSTVDDPFVQIEEIRSERPSKLLGHLALTRFTCDPGVKPSHSVVFMRHAELVVKYFERDELQVPGFQWAGVFKPVPEVDDSFALAEPPAHDDWNPKSVHDKAQRTDVNVALKKIREKVDKFLAPNPTTATENNSAVSAAHVGDALADLIGGLDGPAPSTRKASPGGTSTRRPKVNIVDVNHQPSSTAGWVRTTIHVEVTVNIGVDGGSLSDEESIEVLGWQELQQDAFDPDPREFGNGELALFVYEAKSELAIDLVARQTDR